MQHFCFPPICHELKEKIYDFFFFPVDTKGLFFFPVISTHQMLLFSLELNSGSQIKVGSVTMARGVADRN